MQAPSTPEEARKLWVETWKNTGAALEQIRAEDLRALTEEDSARIAMSLCPERDLCWLPPERIDSSGLIEQQRFFMKSPQHASRLPRER